MADINKLKDKIKSTIYPNGKGAINASDHQAMLLDMADGINETSSQFASILFEPGNVGASGESANTVVSRTNYIPCKKGDVISGYVYVIKLYDKDFNWLGEEVPSNDNGFISANHTITNESCAYIRIVARNSELNKGSFSINNISIEYLINKGANENIIAAMSDAKLGVETSNKNLVTLQSFFFADSDNATSTSFYIPIAKGDIVSAYVYRVKKYNQYKEALGEDLTNISWVEYVDYEVTDEKCRFIQITTRLGYEGSILVNGKNVIQYIIEDLTSKGDFNANELYFFGDSNNVTSTSFFIPVVKGDVVSATMYRIKKYNQDRVLLGEDMSNIGWVEYVDYVVSDNECKFIKITTRKGFEGEILLNGKNVIPSSIENITRPTTISKETYPYVSYDTTDINAINLQIPQFRNNLDGAILGVWVKNPKEGAIYHLSGFRYRQVSAEWKNTEYSNITIAIVAETTQYAKILDDFTSESINDGVQVFDTEDYTIIVDWTKAVKGTGRAFLPNDYTIMSDIVLKKHNTIYLTLNDSNALNKGNGETNSLDALPYIAMPIPSLAMVNIVANNLPTTKTEDVRGMLEFNDMQGNRFTKNVIINAQGTSSLGLAKKNFSIDIMDENYDESHELKFGDWVSQDGFHLKAYLLDGVRVKPLAAYTFYENMLLTRGIIKDRAWKRMQLPLEISATSNNISDSYLQIDDGAKNHPMGFPFILYFNGVFYGIYCWQLKKHRKNYHQKKSTAEHIHLDGNISNPLLWKANGNIDWNKWAGKEYESSDSNNKEGIEIRNPKKLILTDGSVYEGEVNQGELVGYDSPNYNPSDEDMVRTAKVRDYIQNLSIRMNAITNMQKGDEKKLAIAELFDVESIIDYIIFGQIMCNVDGYKKNWQWVTYDGIKWAVNAYDLDSVWGWNGVNYVPALGGWYTNDAPPVLVVLENYIDEIKARYAELRDNGVISVRNIVKPLADYVKTIGVDFYDLEFQKWTMGVRDNLWRFEVWMEESIRNTDALMGYNS